MRNSNWKQRNVSSKPNNKKKIIEISFFLFGDVSKKKHEILGNFSVFSIRSITGNP